MYIEGKMHENASITYKLIKDKMDIFFNFFFTGLSDFFG